jgi:hypothetical protein
MTVRSWTIARAALRCLKAWHAKGHHRTHTRAVLAYVLGGDLDPTWSTGAVFGCLSTDHAEEVAQAVAAYQAREQPLKDVLDALVDAG